MDQKYQSVLQEMERWLAAPELAEGLRPELAELQSRLIKNPDDAEALEDIYERFYKELTFGTGGLRGILGAGTNRMNLHTVGRAAQAFANYINAEAGRAETGQAETDQTVAGRVRQGRVARDGAVPAVAIAYDSRNMSKDFALETAAVMAANGIRVYIYAELMPTPALSFAVRYYGCRGGVMITASHNPSQYNGFKAYNAEGCQLDLQQAGQVYDEIQKLDLFSDIQKLDPSDARWAGFVHQIPQQTVDDYLEAVLAERMGVPCQNISVVYTPLCGAGNKPVRRALREIGVAEIIVVPQQEQPDGNFRTCPYPNPEKREALAVGLELCRKTGRADLLLATDPDCDRVGVAVRTNGDYALLTGNEIAVLLLDFICHMRSSGAASAKPLPQNPLAIRTIVSSRMTDAVAVHYGVEMKTVLTGFKFIGQQIGLLERRGEQDRYIFGFEESYGYLSGVYVRDKDAVNASVLICEMAAFYKAQGKTLFDRLEELGSLLGCYCDEMADFTFPGASGMEKMERVMTELRQNPPGQIGGKPVVSRTDYLHDDTGLPKSNVLSFSLEGDSGMIVRPSGTEPKLKFYLSARGQNKRDAAASMDALRHAAKEIIEKRNR